jgi:hypothetical protein
MAVGITRRYTSGSFGQGHLDEAGERGTGQRPMVCFHQSPLTGRTFDVLMRASAGGNLWFGLLSGPKASAVLRLAIQLTMLSILCDGHCPIKGPVLEVILWPCRETRFKSS